MFVKSRFSCGKKLALTCCPSKSLSYFVNMRMKKRRRKTSYILRIVLIVFLLTFIGIFAFTRTFKNPSRKKEKPSVKQTSLEKKLKSEEKGASKEATETAEKKKEKVNGVLMFRGNFTHTYYGEGPVPKNPKILWKFPTNTVMSSPSSEGGKTRIWSGTGWTGQPAVVEWKGKTWVIFGAYDRAVHFLDAETGRRILPDFKTGDIIKGSVAFDPDGFPLVYFGSRDNYFRILALDREKPTLLWKLSAYAVKNRVWNDDWDACPIIWNDYLFEGGENSHFFIIKLNRGYDENGKVQVKPRIILDFPAFDQELFRKIGDRNVSIENSPVLYKDTVYFANSGGMIYGIDISGLGEKDSTFPVKFKFWAGDDIDASLVVDEEGMLYACVELERFLPRTKEIGQILKLNPKNLDNPLLWSIPVPAKGGGKGGVWATPAIQGNMLYVPTHTGRLLGINRKTGKIVWEKPFAYHAWSSPIVIDNVLIVTDTSGVIHAYDISEEEKEPTEIWGFQIPSKSAIESTPVVWKGKIFVGSRDGHFYCLGNK